MTLQMGLTGSAILFVALHFLLSHPLRAPLVRAVGEGPFRGIYSLVAIVTFAAMVYFYHKIGREPRIYPPPSDVMWIIASILMWLASILLVGSFFKNPALVGAPGPKGGPAGVLRITRHPMMWSFALWALVHLVVVATGKALVFDVAILVLALGGAAAQDSKKSRAMGEDWHDRADRIRPLHQGRRQPRRGRADRRDDPVFRRNLAAPDARRLLALDRLNALKRWR